MSRCKACIEANKLREEALAETMTLSNDKLLMALHLKRWHCTCEDKEADHD
jgi:hypothetical protein